MLLLGLALAGCHGRAPKVPERDWKKSNNIIYYLAYRALGRPAADFPEPGLTIGKATLPEVTSFLQSFPAKPSDVKDGDTADKGFHYLEATLDDQLRAVYYFARDGGYQDKLLYCSCLVFIPGEDDTLESACEKLLGKADRYEKLVLNTDEGREESDVEVDVWRTELGVITERCTYSEEDDTTVAVLELWAPPAYGQARPKL